MPANAADVAPSSATALDFDRPDFWNRVYVIPHHYLTLKLELPVADPSAASEKLKRVAAELGALPAAVNPRPHTVSSSGRDYWWPAANQSLWEIDPARADALAQAFSKLGQAKLERLAAAVSPDVPDLEYKRRELAAEVEIFRPRTKDLPAASGLIDGELLALQPLIEGDERAKKYALVYVTLTGPRVDPRTYGDSLDSARQFWNDRDARPAEQPKLLNSDEAYIGIWRRRGFSDPCGGKPRAIQVDIETDEQEIVEKGASAMLTKAGAAPIEVKCTFDVVNAISYDDILSRKGYWMKEEALRKLKDDLSKLGRLVRWDEVYRDVWLREYAPASEHRAMLVKELEKNADFFARVPLVRSLVRDEIRRLAAPAKIYDDAKGMVFAEVIVMRKTGGAHPALCEMFACSPYAVKIAIAQWSDLGKLAQGKGFGGREIEQIRAKLVDDVVVSAEEKDWMFHHLSMLGYGQRRGTMSFPHGERAEWDDDNFLNVTVAPAKAGDPPRVYRLAPRPWVKIMEREKR